MTLICTTGSPSSKYEHQLASALLRNIQNIRICIGKKPIVSVTYENERISIKNSLMCVTSLLCGPRADLWPFYGFLCKPLYRAGGGGALEYFLGGYVPPGTPN